jgi:hypothetical protein
MVQPPPCRRRKPIWFPPGLFLGETPPSLNGIFQTFVQNPRKLKTSPESFTNSAVSVLRKVNLKAWQT